VIPGQSLLRSRSNNLKFVTKSLISDEGIGFSDCVFVFVLTDKLRVWPWLVLVVAVDDCEVDRDILSSFGHTCALLGVDQQLLPAIGGVYSVSWWSVVFAKPSLSIRILVCIVTGSSLSFTKQTRANYTFSTRHQTSPQHIRKPSPSLIVQAYITL
jgi:hypothetical protein